MHTHISSRPARLIFAALASILFLFLAAGSAGRASANEVEGLGPMKPGGKPVSGPQPFINIPCKFKDRPAEPFTVARMRQIFGIADDQGNTDNSAYPTVDRYWREVSNDVINLDGSRVVGWVTLPGNQSDYRKKDANGNYLPSPIGDGNYEVDFEKLLADCTAAAEAQVVNPDGSRGVNFNLYKGINLFPNNTLDGASHGAPRDITLDGTPRKALPVTWISSAVSTDQSTIVHEMGHGFGLNHSSGPYQKTKDSPWDVMSGGDDCVARPEAPPEFGCIGRHTIAAHKAYLGWIPAARRFDVKPGPATTITLSRLAQPVKTGGVYWMAKLPVLGLADQYYTVEYRAPVGYDRGLLDGIVIHRVDERLNTRNARVVDPDGDGVLTSSARLTAGEVYNNTAIGMSVRVESIDAAAGTARVTVGISPLVSIGDVTVHEPAPAPPPSNDPEPEPDPAFLFSQARFTVRIPAPATAPVSVKYTTAPGTATAGSDYLSKSNTATIPVGATSATIVVDIRRDNIPESPETFFVNLSNPVNGTLKDSQGKGTVLDFD